MLDTSPDLPSGRRFLVGTAIGAFTIILGLVLPGPAEASLRSPGIHSPERLPGRSSARAPIARTGPPENGHPFVYRALGEGFEAEGFEPLGLRRIRIGDPPRAARVLTEDPSDRDPAVSPDGRWVVFTRWVPEGDHSRPHESLFLIRSDGSGLHRLTSGPPGGSDLEASFTPSGKAVLFVRLEDETVEGTNHGDIYSIRTDGSGLRQITSGRAIDRSPVMSPNGRQIVFSRAPGITISTIADIYSIRPNSSHLTDLTPRIPARHRRTERIITATEPTFSPNGRVIAFAVSANGSHGIDTIRPDGRGIRSLTGRGPRALNRRFDLSEPEFSPTGRTLLVGATDSYHDEIGLIDLADRSRLFQAPGVEGESPAW